MKTLIFNVKYSPNLGDGIIAESLEALLQNLDTTRDIESLDLAGRTHFSADIGKARHAVLSALKVCPKPLRQTIMTQLIRRQITSARPHWADRLDSAEAILVGGGQLLADADLNFPMKISAAIKTAPESARIAFFGVGVSPNWSKAGHALFKTALTDQRVKAIYVRDTRSEEILQDYLGDEHPPLRVTSDPGIATHLVYDLQYKKADRPKVGIGVIHPSIEALHKENASISPTDEAFYISLAGEIAEFADPVLFTNGAHEDEVFLQKILTKCPPDLRGKIGVSERSLSPRQLAETIGSFQGLIAHRLHANIIGFSIGMPTVGLVWENKVREFYRKIGEPNRALEPENRTPQHAAKTIRQALSQPHDTSVRDRMMTGLQTDVAEAIELLSSP